MLTPTAFIKTYIQSFYILHQVLIIIYLNMFCNSIFALAMAASALATPVMTKRALFDCNVAYTGCIANPYLDESYCNDTRNSCEACWQTEQSCRVTADYTKGTQCTVDAQLCFHSTENPSSVYGAYSCDAAYSTCIYAPNTNSAFCSVQLDVCRTCETQENQCRSAPGANQAFCSSQSAGCFRDAVTSNGTYPS
ncbi:hypothetical protein D6C81_05714 [Aureobasidium pullulans]|nr:hypothetical protein D6C81_05714 [Aureobasidium pullulans]